MKKYLEVGRIVGTHAIKGEVRVDCWCNSVEDFCLLKTLYYNENGSEKISVKSRPNKNIAIMKINDVETLEAADALRGKILYVDRADLNLGEDEYFIQDIIGCVVKNIDTDEVYGKVTDVFNRGASDIYTVEFDDKTSYYIPVIDDIVIKTDIENGEILIRPMKGLFGDED